MKKLNLVIAAISLAALPACSANAADKCGMSGDWYSFTWAHNKTGQIRWKEDGEPQSMRLRSSKPIEFSADGIITGGQHDGIALGGGVTATSWECQGTERFFLKGNIMGIQERIQVHPEGFWELRSTGFAKYFVKADGVEQAAEKMLYFMEWRAKQRGKRFSGK